MSEVLHGAANECPTFFTDPSIENLPFLLSDVIHNPQHYARDFYFFKRSQYPQLSLTHKKPQEAYNELQAQCFGLKFVEMGKVMLTWGILKNVNQVVQRVVFLHEVRKRSRCRRSPS